MRDQFTVVLLASGLSLIALLGCWVWAMLHGKDVSVTDAYYGFGSFAQGLLTFVLWHQHSARGAILLVLTGLWCIGLGQFLYRRWRKSHAAGGDQRWILATEIVNSERKLWWVSLLMVLAEALFVAVINLPLELAIMDGVRGINVLDVIGFAVIAVGGSIEVLANHQLEMFKRNAANAGKTLMSGLWSWSRHPNYFGHVATYFGFFVVASRSPHLAWTIVSPIAVYVLLRFGSGVRMTDWMMLQKRKDDPEYLAYLRRTSPFLMRPPRRVGSVEATS